MAASTEPEIVLKGGDVIARHALSTRLWHWISAAVIVVMLMSGLMIFNAHPRLYWGSYGANPDPAWLEIGNERDQGYLRVGNTTLPTTGVLGLSPGPGDAMAKLAFPAWATLPSDYDLSKARRWHLSFAWLLTAGTLVFGLWSVLNGHLRRDLLPRASELSPRHIASQLGHHALFRMPCGAAACQYNILQKLVYLGVAGGLIPIMILSGLTMSPWVNSVAPWLLDLFGGRQSARSIHFITAFTLVLFVVVHVVMVVAAGPVNELRSMITGRFRLPRARSANPEESRE